MNVDGKHYRTIWLETPECVRIIDQALLPHQFAFMDLRTPADMCAAIRKMHLRGAGLIGCAAAWGIYLAVRRHAAAADFAARIAAAAAALHATRPTAKNLEWAVARMLRALAGCAAPADRLTVAFRVAQEPLGQALMAARGETVHLAATLTLNRWGGKESAELRVLDLARPV